MKVLALLLSCLAAATAAPSSPVKAAFPYYTPPVYSEQVIYAPHHHHQGYVKPGHVYTGYNGYNNQYTGYNGYNNQYSGYNGYNGYNHYHGHGYNSPYYNLVLKKN